MAGSKPVGMGGVGLIMYGGKIAYVPVISLVTAFPLLSNGDIGVILVTKHK